jgi:hypothetical protein
MLENDAKLALDKDGQKVWYLFKLDCLTFKKIFG